MNQMFDWKPQPKADQMYRQLVDDFCNQCSFAAGLKQQMLAKTGTRLIDWVDHLAVPAKTLVDGEQIEIALGKLGYVFDAENDHGRWFTHEGGQFVPICITLGGPRRLVVCVDEVDDFLAAHRIYDVTIEGVRGGQLRRAKIVEQSGCEFWVCQRRGYQSWTVPFTPDALNAVAGQHYESFKLRRREFDNDADGFELAKSLVRRAIDDLGVDWTCDLFFQAEREYWQRRNRAARVQKDRQDALGLGWANHDHHTYRSSRVGFKPLIEVFELLGFHCRERFYAGEQAGWGAQVLEQPGCGIVIFADVDLSPSELAGDFAHAGLDDQGHLGTVGLWCQLHGEAMLQAGMHHLECTFDFEAARQQLAGLGIESMDPFADFDYLRQAFTKGEIWDVIPDRTRDAVKKGYITAEQAERFLTDGSIGSHLETLERNDGFKGFNQNGVSDIIRKTDPREVHT